MVSVFFVNLQFIMVRSRIYIYRFIALTIMCFGLRAEAQQILREEVDTVACLHDTVIISVGRTSASNIEVQDVDLTLSHAERAFLPDGVSCPPYGCSYRSHVTFSGLDDNVTISSLEDIKYVRLNIEHSWVADLYIGIVCPNGQHASLMNWSGSGANSDCVDEVPAGCRSWTSGTNVSTSTDLGVAVSGTDYNNECDSTSYSNRPGVGWNYCWSSSNTLGYQYGSGDGRIYRSGNAVNGSIDSSNVAQGTHFYRPDQSFSNLYGCPVNGTWYVEVIDAWSGDNGWVFDWELSLNESLVPTSGVMTGRTVLGDQVIQVNDSVWKITSPATATGDTAVDYTVRIYGTGNPSVRDTIVTVHYYAPKDTTLRDTLCWGDTATLAGVGIFTRDTAVVRNLTTTHGCDSVVTNVYTFREKIENIDTFYMCPDQTATLAGGITVTHDTTLSDTLTAVCNCDSIVAKTFIYRAPVTGIDTMRLCVGDTVLLGPLSVVRDTTLLDTLAAVTGCDSVVTRSYVFNDIYEVYDTMAYCRRAEFLYEGIDYGGPAEFVSPHLTVHGCDSIVHVKINMIDSAFAPRILLSDDDLLWADTVLLGCEPYSVSAKDTTPLTVWRQWVWSTGDTIVDDTLVFRTFDTAGVYGLTLMSLSENGCTDTVRNDSAVWVFRNPEAAFGWTPNEPPLHDPQIDFINNSWPQTDMAWLWVIGGTQSSDTSSEFAPHYRWDNEGLNPSGEHTVTLTALWTHHGPDTLTTVCADTVEQTVTVVNDWLQFPSLVTPNGDGINDRWEVVNLVEMGQYPMNEVWIFNEWGVQVFHANNVSEHEEFWDPNATNSPDGTYYFRFTARSLWGVVKQNGVIEVLRN